MALDPGAAVQQSNKLVPPPEELAARKVWVKGREQGRIVQEMVCPREAEQRRGCYVVADGPAVFGR